MEWVAEGLSLIFVGLFPLLARAAASLSRASAAMLGRRTTLEEAAVEEEELHNQEAALRENDV